MDPYSVIEYAKEVYIPGDVVAGSREERGVVERLRRLFEDFALSVALEPVEVVEWRDLGSFVESCGVRCPASLHPYALSFDIEAPAQYVDDPRSVVAGKARITPGAVLILNAPEDPDDYPVISWLAAHRGASGVVYVERGEVLRRIVMLRDLAPCTGRSEPPPIPSLSVRRSCGEVLISKVRNGCRVRVVAKGFVRGSTGHNIVVELGGSKEDCMVYATAHHDKWLGGFSDNTLGVGILIALARQLRSKSSRCSVRLVSFTAEEGGEPSFSPFYWIYGSRVHVKRRWGELDNLLLVVNSDVVFSRPLTLSGSGFEVHAYISKVLGRGPRELKLELDQPIFDSYAFSTLGVSAITINSFEDLLKHGLYHSDGDTPYAVDPRAAAAALEIALKLITSADADAMLSAFRASLSILADNLRKRLPLEHLNEILRAERWIGCLEHGRRRVEAGVVARLARILNRSVIDSVIDLRFTRELDVREESGCLALCRGGVLSIPDCAPSTRLLCSARMHSLLFALGAIAENVMPLCKEDHRI